MTTYCSHNDPSYVDFKEFSNEMEANSTVDPQPYAPTLLMDTKTLLPKEEQILERILHRIVERVRGVLL